MEWNVCKNAARSANYQRTVTMYPGTAKMAVRKVGREWIVWKVFNLFFSTDQHFYITYKIQVMHFIHVYFPFKFNNGFIYRWKTFPDTEVFIPKYQTHCLRRFIRYSEINTFLNFFYFSFYFLFFFLEMHFVAI